MACKYDKRSNAEKTNRELILENIKETLDSTNIFARNYLEQGNLNDADQAPKPCTFIYIDNDVRIRDGVVGLETFLLNVAVEIWTERLDAEYLLKRVHNALYEDTTRGGWAVSTLRTTGDPTNISDNLNAMLCNFEIKYRHEIGNM